VENRLSGHGVCRAEYHIVWIPKYRRRILNSGVAEYLEKLWTAYDWELFKEYYSFSKDGGKGKQLDWLVKLNKIRQTTHHTPKWPATKEQVNFVSEYYLKIIERFKLPEDN
jgi:hypothetical protein